MFIKRWFFILLVVSLFVVSGLAVSTNLHKSREESTVFVFKPTPWEPFQPFPARIVNVHEALATTLLHLKRDRHLRRLRRIVVVGLAQRGVPYLWGGTTRNGFDCSGFVQYVYRHAVGIFLPRTTYAQLNVGSRLRRFSHLRVGDILFFSDADHEGLYIGHGLMLEAAHAGTDVRIRSIAGQPIYSAVRFLLN